MAAYPDIVAGIKDSSGDWDNTRALLEGGWPDFRVFSGSESFLLRNRRAGGAGCISATANVNPAAIRRLCEEWQKPGAAALQEQLDAVRVILRKQPVIAALKAIIAHYEKDPAWATVRPPLERLTDERTAAMIEELESGGFEMAALDGTGATE